jgi:hypothetical protein
MYLVAIIANTLDSCLQGIAKLSRRNWYNQEVNTYTRHRFSLDIINLSHRRCAGPFIEDLLVERGITSS